jgi:hypothetical protein
MKLRADRHEKTEMFHFAQHDSGEYEILTRPFSNEIRLFAWEKVFEDFGAEVDL